MITIDSGLNGLKIGKFIKTNVKSAKKDISIKNAIKVAKVAAPIALSFIPIAGGTASSAASKLLQKVTTSASGKANLIGKAVKGVSQLSKTKVGSSVVKLATPIVKNAKANLLQKAGVIANDAQLETLAEAKGTTPQEELDNIVNNAPATAKDNTMLYVGGGILAVGLAYVAFKK